MPPTYRNRTLQRETISRPQEWENLRPRLTAMYKAMSLPQIKAILESERGFYASDKQYRDRFRQWGLNIKNIKSQLKDDALAEIDNIVVDVSTNMALFKGIEIPMDKLKRRQAERRVREARIAHTRPLRTTEGRDSDAGVHEASNRRVAEGPVSQGQSPVESSSSHTLTAGRDDTPRGGSTRQPSSEASSPGRFTGPRMNPVDPRTIAQNIWALRVFIGLSSWFFDFLQMCRDPALSPLDPDAWEGAFGLQLSAYQALFVLGRTRTAKAARDAVDELRAVLNGEDEAVARVASSSEEINAQAFRTLHQVCDVPYPDEVKLRFSTQEIRQEVQAYESGLTKIRELLGWLKADLAERPRRRLEVDASPFRRGGGSPAAFYFDLREVVKFAISIDIFLDDGLNFAQIRALHPGPHPGPMICFSSEIPARGVVEDPAMYDERDLEQYGVVARHDRWL